MIAATTATALLAALREREIRFWLTDDRKLMLHPREAVSESEWGQLKANREALTDLLLRELDTSRGRTRFLWKDGVPSGTWDWTDEEMK